MVVTWLSVSFQGIWGKGAVLFHTCFGSLMVLTADFSILPLVEEIEFDHTEDILHSLTSTAICFAFVFGVLVEFFQRAKSEYLSKSINGLAICVATLIPLGILKWPGVAGLIQRVMFFVSYVWYGKEALRIAAFIKLHN